GHLSAAASRPPSRWEHTLPVFPDGPGKVDVAFACPGMVTEESGDETCTIRIGERDFARIRLGRACAAEQSVRRRPERRRAGRGPGGRSAVQPDDALEEEQ